MFLQNLKNIKTVILDVDGVLTDGSILITENGEMLRSMNIKDGYAMKHACKNGLQLIVITGGSSKGVVSRLERLGISHVYSGVENKLDVLHKLINDKVMDLGSTLYMGDDMPDLEIMKMARLKACPSDAIVEIQEISDYVSPMAGGKGCVRDVLEKWLKLQNKW